MKPVRTGMFTGRTLPCNALTIAIAEGKAGHLVSACSKCISPDTRGVLQGMENVSHGYCEACLEAAIAEMESGAGRVGSEVAA